MFVLIKEVVFVEWFRIRKIPVRIPRNFKLNSENSEKSSTNCSALLCRVSLSAGEPSQRDAGPGSVQSDLPLDFAN